MGLIGKFNDSFAAKESNTLTIIAVTGVESITNDDNAENCSNKNRIEFKPKNITSENNWKPFLN